MNPKTIFVIYEKAALNKNKRYKGIFKQAKEYFSDKELSAESIDLFFEECLKKGIKPSTIHTKISFMSAAYSFAVLHGLAKENPMSFCLTQKIKRSKRNIFTPKADTIEGFTMSDFQA